MNSHPYLWVLLYDLVQLHCYKTHLLYVAPSLCIHEPNRPFVRNERHVPLRESSRKHNYLTSFFSKISCILMMHRSLSLLLEMLRKQYPDSLLFWRTELGHLLLFNPPSKLAPGFWETYHCTPAHCPV
jgi:hypothetical protein